MYLSAYIYVYRMCMYVNVYDNDFVTDNCDHSGAYCKIKSVLDPEFLLELEIN